MSTQNYSTESLPFACYILSKHALEFIGCEVVPSGVASERVSFAFKDPAQQGSTLKAQFMMGGECSALSFYNAIRFLRTTMTEALSQGRNKRSTPEYGRISSR